MENGEKNNAPEQGNEALVGCESKSQLNARDVFSLFQKYKFDCLNSSSSVIGNKAIKIKGKVLLIYVECHNNINSHILHCQIFNLTDRYGWPAFNGKPINSIQQIDSLLSNSLLRLLDSLSEGEELTNYEKAQLSKYRVQRHYISLSSEVESVLSQEERLSIIPIIDKLIDNGIKVEFIS